MSKAAQKQAERLRALIARLEAMQHSPQFAKYANAADAMHGINSVKSRLMDIADKIERARA